MAEEGDDDLSLDRASVSLLLDLNQSLPKILFKRSSNPDHLPVHSLVRQKDLDYLVKLIDSFQGDPQLLDSHLKTIVPQIAEALLQRLAGKPRPAREGHVDLTTAASILIYTLCKVRGRKVISGLLHNEPRHLDLIITSLEHYASHIDLWQVHFTLLLWLSHLLLTPFNLDSISLTGRYEELPAELSLKHQLPDLAHRSLRLCLQFIGGSAVSRGLAALTVVRLVTRPDMLQLELADSLVDWSLGRLGADDPDSIALLHTQLGMMHFLAGISKSIDLAHLLPKIFRACEALSSSSITNALICDAVARKLLLKIMSTIMMTSSRAVGNSATLSRFLSESDAMEATIESQLECLADRESLVRNAAAKAVSNIILNLDGSMAREVLEALFSILQADMTSSTTDNSMQTADPFAWHGVVLALSYSLFKRSVPADQLSILVKILLRALAFEQRSATGSLTGTNVRDAANFGLWSLARRSTSVELACIDLHGKNTGAIVIVAVRLLQSACLDPVGNIRRGSSAALQELIGRHPNQVPNGIALIQAVDFVGVGLRQRALIDVAASAMSLDQLFFDALVAGLIDWRGLGSADTSSREYAATSLAARAIAGDRDQALQIIEKLVGSLKQCPKHDVERLHGLISSLALSVGDMVESSSHPLTAEEQAVELHRIWNVAVSVDVFTNAFEHRAMRTNLASAVVRLVTGFCRHEVACCTSGETTPGLAAVLRPLLVQLLTTSNETLLEVVPALIRALLPIHTGSSAYECVELSYLAGQLKLDISKPTLQGAARAFAIGASVRDSLQHGAITQYIMALRKVCQSTYVDWRIVGFKAIGVALGKHTGGMAIDPVDLQMLVDIINSGLEDYTIDQRGDVGSLVRIEALNCASVLSTTQDFRQSQEVLRKLHAGIARLSLEKLNRVRAKAAECRRQLPGPVGLTMTTDDVDSEEYFSCAIAPLWETNTPPWVRRALLQGLPSCAGSAAEHLTRNSRAVINNVLSAVEIDVLQRIVDDLVAMLTAATADSQNLVPILELMVYLLQSRIMQRLNGSSFKWRQLLVQVQKAHYKSTDIPRLLAAVSLYTWLADVESVRQDVLKKLLSMLTTIPYPKVRAAIADSLFCATDDEALKSNDWHLPASQNAVVLAEVRRRHITA